MILDELELKHRYNDYLREVRQEQLYQQVKANQSNLVQRILMGLGDLFNRYWTTFRSQKLCLNRFLKEYLRQFKIGDRVVHPAHGTGQIVNVEEKRFSEKRAGLYYEVTLPKFTLWVPVETQGASGLRLETAKNEFDQHPDLWKSPLAPYEYKPPAAPLALVSRLKQGSFGEGGCPVVRDFTAWGCRKSHGPDQYAHLAEDTAQPLSRMGDDG